MRRCAARVLRECPHHALTVDDLLQEGRLAVLVAQRAGRIPAGDSHRTGYLVLRASGAMRDARRRAGFREPFEDPPEAPDEDAVDPERQALLSMHARRLLRRRDLPAATQDVIARLLAGQSIQEIAERRGTSVSAVYQAAYRAVPHGLRRVPIS